MTTFKPGDLVRVVKDTCCHRIPLGTVVTLNDKKEGSKGVFCQTYNPCYVKAEELELIETDKKSTMSIKEKFITALLPEPEKSFRKAGITSPDGLLTPDGQTIFLTWLLNDKGNKEAFNLEVVQPLLEEKEEK